MQEPEGQNEKKEAATKGKEKGKAGNNGMRMTGNGDKNAMYHCAGKKNRQRYMACAESCMKIQERRERE